MHIAVFYFVTAERSNTVVCKTKAILLAIVERQQHRGRQLYAARLEADSGSNGKKEEKNWRKSEATLSIADLILRCVFHLGLVSVECDGFIFKMLVSAAPYQPLASL